MILAIFPQQDCIQFICSNNQCLFHLAPVDREMKGQVTAVALVLLYSSI